MSMQLDHDAFMAAFERVAKRLVKAPYNYAAKGKNYESIPFLRDQKYGELPDTLEELIEDNLEEVAIANFITLLVVREMSPSKKQHREKALVLKTKRGEPRFRFFDGDLHVAGNFAYECAVLVQGDLTVDGVIEDAFEASPLLVGGNVRAKGMYIGSETKIAGMLDVEDVLHLRFTRGGNTLLVEGGAKTKLYIYTRDDSRMTGKLMSKLDVEAYPKRDDVAFTNLRSQLAPGLARKLDADEPEMTLIVKSLRERATIWR